jgi:transposase
LKFHSSDGATSLIGMAGFVVGGHLEVDGEWWISVQTTSDLVGCPDCGTRAVGHGRRRVRIRDLPVSGRPVVLVWSKRIWRCPDSDCETRTWTERSELIDAGGLLTVRAGAEICRAVGADDTSVAAVARRFGISWAAAMAAVERHGRLLVDDPDRVGVTTALGVDETTFLHAGPKQRTEYITGMVDLDRGLLLDVVEGRSGQVVIDWLEAQPEHFRSSISVAAIDAFRGYANALSTSLPAATLVMDCFHAVALANRTVDKVRRRVQHETLGHRDRRDDPLYKIRRLALVGAERLNEKGWERLLAGIEASDPSGHLGVSWIAKEELRRIYAAKGPGAARAALERFYLHCTDHAQVPEVLTLAKTVSAWEDQILAYHDTGGASNGPTEAVNLLIEKVRRIGHGFRSFRNYRLRLLLACGIRWKAPRVARIRGRQPCSVA